MYYLSACLLFKNEAHYLKEWLWYHILLGFEHFYLFDNDSTDESRSVLKPFVEKKTVTLVPFPGKISLLEMHGSYMQCVRMFSQETRWCAFLDVDEFLCLRHGRSAKLFVRELEGRGAHCILLNWLHASVFNHGVRPEGLLSVEAYPLASKAGNDEHVKCIVQLERVQIFHDPHCPQLLPGGSYVDEAGSPIPGEPLKPVRREKAFIYHLYAKSLQEHLFWKLGRVHTVRDLARVVLEDPEHITSSMSGVSDIRKRYGNYGIEIWRTYNDPRFSTPLPYCTLQSTATTLRRVLEMPPETPPLLQRFRVFDWRGFYADFPEAKDWVLSYKQRSSPPLLTLTFFESDLCLAFALLTDFVPLERYVKTAEEAGLTMAQLEEICYDNAWDLLSPEMVLHYWGTFLWHLPVGFDLRKHAVEKQLTSFRPLPLLENWYAEEAAQCRQEQTEKEEQKQTEEQKEKDEQTEKEQKKDAEIL